MAPKRRATPKKAPSRRRDYSPPSPPPRRQPRRDYSPPRMRPRSFGKISLPEMLLLAAGLYGVSKMDKRFWEGTELDKGDPDEKDEDFNVDEDATKSQVESYNAARKPPAQGGMPHIQNKIHKSQCEIEMACLLFKGPGMVSKLTVLWEGVAKKMKEVYKNHVKNLVFYAIPLTAVDESTPYVPFKTQLVYWSTEANQFQPLTITIPEFSKSDDVIIAWPIYLKYGHYILFTIYLDNTQTPPKMYFNVLDGSNTVDDKYGPSDPRSINTSNAKAIAGEMKTRLEQRMSWYPNIPDDNLKFSYTTRHYQEIDTVGLCSLFTLFGAWHFLTTPSLWTKSADETMADLLYVTHTNEWNELAAKNVLPPEPRTREEWLEICKKFRAKAKFVFKQIGMQLPSTLKQNRI